jgi:hypothetical protein
MIMKKLFILSIAFFALNITLQAQNDPNVGFYADGVKVTELNCYTFGSLTVVLPYDKGFENFNEFLIYGDVVSLASGHVFEKNISKGALLSNNIKGKYMVFDVFANGSQSANSNTNLNASISRPQRGMIGCKGKKEKEEDEYFIHMYGLTITHYQENFDAGCQCIKRTPVYKQERVGAEVKVSLKNRVVVSMFGVCSQTGLKLSQPCDYTGTKVDFTNFGGSNKNTNSNFTNNSGVDNTSVNITTTPYTEKYPGGKLKVQGQKSKDGLQEGTWKYLDETGKLIRTENYLNGMAEGEWKYFKDGKVVKTEMYKGGEIDKGKKEEEENDEKSDDKDQ